MSTDPLIWERFERARQVWHPNVCQVRELFVARFADDDEVPFFTMELLQGETLYRRVER
jgi:hypothetical protein